LADLPLSLEEINCEGTKLALSLSQQTSFFKKFIMTNRSSASRFLAKNAVWVLQRTSFFDQFVEKKVDDYNEFKIDLKGLRKMTSSLPSSTISNLV
jgi:hypothetical protein